MSVAEGLMEGVFVSVKKVGSTITITVVSDDEGWFRFFSAKLGSGCYSLRSRAVGYDLDGSGEVEVVSGVTVIVNLKLKRTSDFAVQFFNVEWLVSFFGIEQQKASIRRCMHCHTLKRVAQSRM